MTAPTIIPLGSIPSDKKVPELMYASVIRPERYGQPLHAFRVEEVPVPPVGEGQVLVYVMASGVNYNNVWAALGKPIDIIAMRQKLGDPNAFHIGGSEASGVVWAVGSKVRQVKIGQHVVVSACRWDEHADDIRMGADPMTSASQKVWGYEENFGSFAQFTVVDEYQCHPKPANLSWEEAASLGTAATAYRMLRGWPPNVVAPGDPVLVWGAAGGVGSGAIQIARLFGARPIAVVSGTDEKAEHCMKLGAVGIINRKEFEHWGRLPDQTSPKFRTWQSEVKRFGARFWEALGEKKSPKIVVEHPGQDTLPTSVFMCENAGMIVICGGTSGYYGDVDLRYLWMRQKRLQGSHFANREQCAAVLHLASEGRIKPCLGITSQLPELGALHQMIHENKHPGGNIAILVNAPEQGMKTVPN